MTIQRKYSLPNCTLILEGLSDASTSVPSTDMRPLLSILVNTECHLAATAQPLIGGSDFFESLVTAVSGYAQEFLSQVHHPEAHNNQQALVQLQKIDNNRHRLLVYSERKQREESASSNSAAPPITIDLTTVQLFDLVEAVDQFFADSQTLPSWSLQISPVSKRYASSNQRLAKQAVPAAVGVSSLALAAIALFFVPLPAPVKPRLEPRIQHSSSTTPNTKPTIPGAP